MCTGQPNLLGFRSFQNRSEREREREREREEKQAGQNKKKENLIANE
jgi:hypothetical protein